MSAESLFGMALLIPFYVSQSTRDRISDLRGVYSVSFLYATIK